MVDLQWNPPFYSLRIDFYSLKKILKLKSYNKDQLVKYLSKLGIFYPAS